MSEEAARAPESTGGAVSQPAEAALSPRAEKGVSLARPDPTPFDFLARLEGVARTAIESEERRTLHGIDVEKESYRLALENEERALVRQHERDVARDRHERAMEIVQFGGGALGAIGTLAMIAFLVHGGHTREAAELGTVLITAVASYLAGRARGAANAHARREQERPHLPPPQAGSSE